MICVVWTSSGIVDMMGPQWRRIHPRALELEEGRQLQLRRLESRELAAGVRVREAVRGRETRHLERGCESRDLAQGAMAHAEVSECDA